MPSEDLKVQRPRSASAPFVPVPGETARYHDGNCHDAKDHEAGELHAVGETREPQPSIVRGWISNIISQPFAPDFIDPDPSSRIAGYVNNEQLVIHSDVRLQPVSYFV